VAGEQIQAETRSDRGVDGGILPADPVRQAHPTGELGP
jgi:hypothetical protein